MDVLDEVILGDCIIDVPTRLVGTVTGDLFVTAGGLDLVGMVIGSVVVDDGDVLVGGTVGHDVINRGGRVRVTGTVTGEVFGASDNTRIDPAAKAAFGREAFPEPTQLQPVRPQPDRPASTTAEHQSVGVAPTNTVDRPSSELSDSGDRQLSEVRLEKQETSDSRPSTTAPSPVARIPNDATAGLKGAAASPSAKDTGQQPNEVTFVENLAEWLPVLADRPLS